MSTHRSSRRRASVAAALALLVLLAACGSENIVKDGAASKDKAVPTLLPGSTVTTLPSAKGKACKQATDVPAATGKPTVLMPTGKPPTTLQKADLKVGTGAEVKAGETITVNYVGISCSSGKQFDSSWDTGRTPFTTKLDTASIIDGWVQGLPGMKVGGRRQLVIPPALGYGTTGNNGIAPDETLVFIIDLISIGEPATTTTAAGTATTVAGTATTTTAAASTTEAESTTSEAVTTTTTAG